jgi:outer membrane protein TolC
VSPSHETDLVEGFIAGPAFQSELAASAQTAVAAGTGPALFENPELQARHEDARGPTGANTDALGAELTVDLGFSATGHRQAAELRGQAGMYRQRAVALQSICAFRDEVLELWTSQEKALVATQAQARLEHLLEQTTALAGAGDVPGYDRDRTALVLVTHEAALMALVGAREGQRTRVIALSSAAVDHVVLAPRVEPVALDGLLEAAQQNPELVALRLELEAAELELSATRREAVPDLALYGGARWDDEVDGSSPSRGYEVGASLELPVFDMGQAERADAGAGLAGAQALLLQREQHILARVEAAAGLVAQLDTALVPPDADALWAAATERYFADEGGIGALVDLADDLEAAGLSGVQHHANLRRADLELSCAVGAFREPTLQSALEDSLR